MRGSKDEDGSSSLVFDSSLRSKGFLPDEEVFPESSYPYFEEYPQGELNPNPQFSKVFDDTEQTYYGKYPSFDEKKFKKNYSIPSSWGVRAPREGETYFLLALENLIYLYWL